MKFSNLTAAAALAVAVLSLAACGNDSNSTGTTPPTPPTVTGLTVAANDNSVLSAIITLSTTHTDSARAVYVAGTDSSATPFASDLSGGRILVLGLKPSTAYKFYVQAIGSGSSKLTTTSDTVAFTTGALPAFLASSNISSATPSPGGYIMTTIGDGSTWYAAAYDSTGRVAWYRAFPGGVPANEVKQQMNGDFTVTVSQTHGGDLTPGVTNEVAPDGSLVRTFTAPDSSYLDEHEFWLMFRNGAYDGALFLAYTARHFDLSAQGHSSDTVVTGHQLVRQDANGNQRVIFDAWDHWSIANTVEPISGQRDFDHANAITFDSNGNYIVSWRNLDIITEIDSASGALVWTLASPSANIASDFTIAGDALNGFSAQHSVRYTGNNTILFFDNGTRHVPSMSRAVEYHLDTSAHTATLVYQFLHAPAIYTPFTGTTQRLANGNTIIGYTWTAPFTVTEANAAGSVVWEGILHTGQVGTIYRFTKVRSLYSYEVP